MLTVCAQVETELALSFVMEAEMVFTTLSSTGRKVFARLPPNAFETVLIYEAAQASEIAALQPLTFGCKRWAHIFTTCLQMRLYIPHGLARALALCSLEVEL